MYKIGIGRHRQIKTRRHGEVQIYPRPSSSRSKSRLLVQSSNQRQGINSRSRHRIQANRGSETHRFASNTGIRYSIYKHNNHHNKYNPHSNHKYSSYHHSNHRSWRHRFHQRFDDYDYYYYDSDQYPYYNEDYYYEEYDDYSDNYSKNFRMVELTDQQSIYQSKINSLYKTNDDSSNPRDCNVCYINIRSVVINCGHALFCLPCIEQIRQQGKNKNKCPCCKKKITKLRYFAATTDWIKRKSLKKMPTSLNNVNDIV